MFKRLAALAPSLDTQRIEALLDQFGARAPHPGSIELQPDRFDDRRPPGNVVFDEAPEFVGR
jgi:hypothetical protein